MASTFYYSYPATDAYSFHYKRSVPIETLLYCLLNFVSSLIVIIDEGKIPVLYLPRWVLMVDTEELRQLAQNVLSELEVVARRIRARKVRESRAWRIYHQIQTKFGHLERRSLWRETHGHGKALSVSVTRQQRWWQRRPSCRRCMRRCVMPRRQCCGWRPSGARALQSVGDTWTPDLIRRREFFRPLTRERPGKVQQPVESVQLVGSVRRIGEPSAGLKGWKASMTSRVVGRPRGRGQKRWGRRQLRHRPRLLEPCRGWMSILKMQK